MRHSIFAAAGASLLACAHPAALAQGMPPAILRPAPAAAPNVSTAPIQSLSSSNAYLRAGTEVYLKLSEGLTTEHKQLHVGQRVRLETAEPVVVEGTIVVPVGSQAVGEITDVVNKGMWGKSGHFSCQIRYLTVNGRQIRMSGTFDDKGTAGGIGAVAVSAIVFLPAGFFMTGTSAKLPAGTMVKGYIDEDVALSLVAQTPAPMQVMVPTTAASAMVIPSAK